MWKGRPRNDLCHDEFTSSSNTAHVGATSDALKVRCNESMLKARELVKRLENELGQEPEDGIYNIAVSHDATWQKRGFTSLYGAVFVILELTGQVLDYEFMSKTCPSCRLWMYQDHSSPAYEKFIEQHKVDWKKVIAQDMCKNGWVQHQEK